MTAGIPRDETVAPNVAEVKETEEWVGVVTVGTIFTAIPSDQALQPEEFPTLSVQ
jgi:hypothetical protein